MIAAIGCSVAGNFLSENHAAHTIAAIAGTDHRGKIIFEESLVDT
jgi:hypothetical protein